MFKCIGVFLGLFCLLAQTSAEQPDGKRSKSVFEGLSGIKKKTGVFNLYLNTHASFNAYFREGDPEETAFKFDQLRIEATGQVNDWISYRWRQMLNASNQAQSLDNLPHSIDYAGIGFRLTPQFLIFAGKQCTAFGGFEFDANPIEIYEYSDMVNYINCFLTGIDFAYQVTPTQEIRFQIVDSRTGSLEDMFGKLPEGIEKSKAPLGYSLNWNGILWKGLIKTRWSVSLFNDAKRKYMYYYAAGTELVWKRFSMYFDFMYSKEALDREGIISRILYEADEETRALNTRYISYVAKLNYRFYPKWNVFLKGMYETASVYKQNGNLAAGKYRTAYGYLGGIEFYPLEDDLHFFLTWVGRSYDFTSKAREWGAGNYDTQRLSVGFIYKIPLF